MLQVDGSTGGGQVLRSALTLSLVTGQAVRVRGIRANRPRPGLRNQHLAAVRLAARIGGAEVLGAATGSQDLTFEPSTIRAGDHEADVGTAGSATLILQTVLLPLLRADAPSTVTVTGGTHNRSAPPFDFLHRAWVPRLRELGADLSVRLDRHGFEPEGGGRVTASVEPSPLTGPLELTDPGELLDRRAHVLLADLPRHIAERELDAIRQELGWPRDACTVGEVPADGAGNALLLEVVHEHVTEVVTGFGRLGVPAEEVAGEAVAALQRYLDPGVAVGPHLADQLLLPMALADGGELTTVPATSHLITNAEVIQRFLGVTVAIEETGPRSARVTVR
ncbi:MAG: RNA 3'-terminal phosphate cyclase [Actinobacteria bacterium]|nr:RNA 3'-terminal phosphate cyclase [Actinomycetota bacterium]